MVTSYVAFVAMLGLLPFVLVACRRQLLQLIRGRRPRWCSRDRRDLHAGGAFLHRYRRGPCAK